MAFTSLDIALSGLKAAQRALDVTSNNISNASTVGYTRKILPQETLIAGQGGEGVGVRALPVIRNVDQTLLRDMVRQYSIKENADVTQAYLDRIQTFHGPSDAERAISFNVSHLKDSFTALSDSPEDRTLIDKVIIDAQETATQINEFSKLITQMRNESQEEITLSINEVNSAIEIITKLNVQINQLSSGGFSTAELEDQRDIAIKTIAKHMEVSTFSLENGKLAVMTRQGQILADDTEPRKLVFQPITLLPGSYYPGGGAAGIFIDSPTGVEITAANLGGKIGALLDQRDTILPQYMAQLDEFAQKMSERFASEGLSLFTDSLGNIPASVADPGLVGYVGYSAQIQVNPDVLANHALIREGTTGATIASGSNEVVRRIIDFTFGRYAYEESTGSVDISAGNLFTSLGLTPHAQVIGTTNISAIVPSLDTDPNIAGGAQFTINVGIGPQVITINPGDTALNLVNQINAVLVTANNPASLNGLGQLVMNVDGNFSIADVSLGANGIAALGHSFGVFLGTDPSFTIAAGTQTPSTITIVQTDTAADLLASLNAVPGITASLDVNGFLVITPTDGGDITFNDGEGSPLAALGMTTVGVAHNAFRQNNLGPNNATSTDLLSIETLEDYGRAFVSYQSEAAGQAKTDSEKQGIFFSALEQRQLDQTGVDLDQEISALIRIQTAYSAAAKMISATERLFDDLLSAFRF